MINIKEVIIGREQEIVLAITGANPAIFNGRHQACPACQGKDRFRTTETGYFCSGGESKEKTVQKGDFIGLIAHIKYCSYKEACELIEDYLGIKKETKEQKITRERNTVINVEKQRKRILEREKMAEIAAKNAVVKANRIWNGLQEARINHPYLIKKKVTGFELRQFKNVLVVPLFNMKREIKGLQMIQPDGVKKFMKGQKTEGFFSFIGKLGKNKKMLTCEGYSTGESLHLATGLPVLLYLSSNNFIHVMKKWINRGITIINMADNDMAKQHEGKANAGSLSVVKARSVGLDSIQLPFIDYDMTDWNDYADKFGLDSLRDELAGKISSL